MENEEQTPITKENKFAKNSVRFFFMFTFFYSSLTMITKINHRFFTIFENVMDNLGFGVLLAASLSFVYVLLTFNDK